MKLQQQGSWKRRGISLLWDAGALREVLDPSEVVSIRQFFELSQAWPEAEYVVVAGAGHSAMEPGIRRALVSATDRLRTLTPRRQSG